MRVRAPRQHAVRRTLAAALTAAATASAGGLSAAPATASHEDPAPTAGTSLHLVTFDSPGLAALPGGDRDASVRLSLLAEQDSVLARVGAPEPVYRWTTALTGVAVELTPAQAEGLEADPSVALVEHSTVRRLAGSPAAPSGPPPAPGRGGAGVVIAMVDTGLDPRSPVFAAPGSARVPAGFRGRCEARDGWDQDWCGGKVVAARSFVEGFGADRVRSTSTLSALDDHGHGTVLASIAAGAGGVTVRAGSARLDRYSGVAPRARLAVYKACWAAPDPVDDGCSTADLVAAIDQATADGVDVLSLAVGGPGGIDTVDRALLGAAEAGVVVVGAAGHRSRGTYAAHPVPWVTTVGGTTGVRRFGSVVLRDGPRLAGAMSATRRVGPAAVVLAGDVAAPGATPAAARTCEPGSLDAGLVRGRVVVCQRGRVGRVDKSEAVLQADGVGMVLVNARAGTVHADLHSVPTVHVDVRDGRALRRWVDSHPGGRALLVPRGASATEGRVVGWSSPGDPAGAVLKPDVVAPATGVLGAVPASVRASRWDFVTGTSAATAYAAGAAAVLLGRHDWSAATVRSALATTAATAPGGSVLRAGAGRVRPSAALTPGVVHDLDPGAYRRWLAGEVVDLNLPSVLLHEGRDRAHRTLTNVSGRRLVLTPAVTGFRHHRVEVTPAVLRLAPGRSATYTVRVAGPEPRPFDDGFVTWRGRDGSLTRVPVLLTR